MNKLKPFRLSVYLLFICSITFHSCNKTSGSNNLNLEFKLLTDTSIQTCNNNDSSKLKFNLLEASKNNQVLDKYYSGNGNIITINSIETANNKPLLKITTAYNYEYINEVSAPYWADINEWLTFENNKFQKVFSYPQRQGNQEGPNIKLIDSKIEADHIILVYDFQQYGYQRSAGYGTVTLEINLKDDKYYLSNYECDVKGYFKVIDEEEDIWVPDSNGDKIIVRDITAEDFLQRFSSISVTYKK